MGKKEKSNWDVGPTKPGQPTGALEHLWPISVVSRWTKMTQPSYPHCDLLLAVGCLPESVGVSLSLQPRETLQRLLKLIAD